MPTHNQFSNALIKWHLQSGRHHLPWQQSQTPYRVWISEIMLQQTQVSTVVPYFERFMQRFPTLQDLAQAPTDDVLAYWSGLGYYSRARNLHRTAQLIEEQHQGRFPQSVEELIALPGIGRSTAGAILSLSMKIRAPILDGNVKRVLSRFFAVTEPVQDSQTQKRLWEVADSLTPTDNVHYYTQAIMDLGATVCTQRAPLCETCPVQKHCTGYKMNPIAFPVKRPKTKAKPSKEVQLLILKHPQHGALLVRRPSKGVWADLWSFPEYPSEALDKHLNTFCEAHYGVDVSSFRKLPSFVHTFTHFHLTIHPIEVTVSGNPIDNPQQIWYKMIHPAPGGIPAPVQMLLQSLET